MNNTKKFILVSFSIMLVLGLFVAMICSYFLPFGDEEVFAEVDSVSTGVDFNFDFVSFGPASAFSYSIYQSWTTIGSFSGTVVVNDTYSFNFTYLQIRRVNSDYPNRIKLVSSTYAFELRYTNSSDNQFLAGTSGIMQLINASSSSVVVAYNDITSVKINFSVFNVGSITNVSPTLLNLFKSSLSLPSLDYTPVFTVYSQDYPSQNSYLLGLLGYNANLLWNPVAFYSGTFDSIQFTNYKELFDGYDTPMPDLIFEYSYNFKDGDSWYHENTTTFTISLNPDGTFIPIFNCYLNVTTAEVHNVTWFIQPISFYYDGYSDYKYEFDLTGSTFLDNQFCNIANLNIMYLDIYSADFYGHSNVSSYNHGYSDGINADKTLLSVMWQTFSLPFRLLFGTYDEDPLSSTYQTYTGGLFNFTLLGVDMRGFCIGIMSFAIILAIIRLIIGIKG